MRKKSIKVINVAHKLAIIVASRDITHNLKQLVLAARLPKVSLDFQDVEFVSRSAAHELLVLREELSKKSPHAVELSFINTDEHVANMLKIVDSSRISPKKRPSNLHIKKISFDSLRSLASI